MAVPKPDRFVWFGDIHGPKPYEFIGVSTGAPVLWHPICGQTCRQAPPVDKTAVKDRSRPAIRARHYRSPAASGPNLVGSPGAPNVKSLKLLFSAHCGPPCFSKRNTTEQRNAFNVGLCWAPICGAPASQRCGGTSTQTREKCLQPTRAA